MLIRRVPTQDVDGDGAESPQDEEALEEETAEQSTERLRLERVREEQKRRLQAIQAKQESEVDNEVSTRPCTICARAASWASRTTPALLGPLRCLPAWILTLFHTHVRLDDRPGARIA